MRYRREIDGLRALAVIPVIFFHAGFSVFSGGFVGVDVFFVISGFLITSIILSEQQTGTFSFASFWERRARRILPALFLVVGVCMAAAWFVLSPKELRHFAQSAGATAVFASNLWFFLTSNYFSSAAELKPLLHTWSLAVEEQYYLFFPIAFAALWKLGARRALWVIASIGVASFACSVWLTHRSPTAAFYLLPTRAWELVVGVCVAFYLSAKPFDVGRWRGILGLIGLALLLGSMVMFDQQTPFPGPYAMVPVVGTALVIAFASEDTFAGKLLGARVLVGAGLVSYSAYLWHQPLFAFARHVSLDPVGPPLASALIAATFVAAFFSWQFVESPFRNRSHFSRRQVFAMGTAGSALLLCIGLVGNRSSGFPHRFDAATRSLFDTTMTTYEQDVKNCWGRIIVDPRDACRLGLGEGKPSVALVGDSHAGALLPELEKELERRELVGLSYTSRSCPPLKHGVPAVLSGGERECIAIRAAFFQELGRSIPQIVVMHARWTFLMEKERFTNESEAEEPGGPWEWNSGLPGSHEEAMAANFSASVEAAISKGHKVVLVYPVPEMGWDVPARLARLHLRNGHLNAADGSISYVSFLRRNARTYAALDAIPAHPNLIRVRPADLLCNTFVIGRCVAHIEGRPVFYDGNHMTNAGARLVVLEIAKVLPSPN